MCGAKGHQPQQPPNDALRLVFDTAALRRRFMESLLSKVFACIGTMNHFDIFEDEDEDEDDWRRFMESR